MSSIINTLEDDAKAEIVELVSQGVAAAEVALIAAINAEMVKVPGVIEAEIAKYLPALVQAVVSAAAKSAIQLAVTGEQALTKLIPGQLDNEILDPIVSGVLSEFSHLFGV